MFAINKLRRLRKKEGNAPAFDRFEEMVKTSLDDLTITPHGYTRATFASRPHDDLWQLVDAQLRRLSDAGQQVFLNSGTLLGVTREKRLIEHDDDLDLALVLKANTAAAAAKEWNELTATLRDQGIIDLKKTNSPSVLKLQGTGDLDIDLFPCWIEDGRIFVFPYSYGALAEEDFFPLQTCTITQHQIPANPEKVLAQNYESDWATPDPYFKFAWLKARRKFPLLLDDLNEVA